MANRMAYGRRCLHYTLADYKISSVDYQEIENDMEKLNCKSLMIGDWVLINGTPRKIQAVDGVDDEIMANDELYTLAEDRYHSEDKVDGVSLTPEILEKNGFTYYESDGSFVLLTNMSYGNWNVDVVLFNITHEHRNNQLHIATPDDSITLLHLMECNHVHELQHALCLCGIEKEIKL